MIENISLSSIIGAPAVGPDEEKIGTVGQVFVDPATGAPNWATVHTGLFGRHENFVPLEQASWDREKLHLPYGKDMVKDAPRIAADEALTPQSEEELYLYYGIGTASSDADQRAETQANAEGERHHDAEAEAAGAEYAQQSRMQRYAASDGDANPDAAPPVSATATSTAEQPAAHDPAVDSVPVASEPAHTDAAPHDGQPKGPRHRA